MRGAVEVKFLNTSHDDMVQDVMDIWGTMDEDTQELSIGLDEFKNAWTDLGGHKLWKSRARAPATDAARRAEERDGTADADAGATEPLTDTAAGRVHAPIPDSDSDEEEDGDAETLYNDIRRANAHATLHRAEMEEDQIFTKRRVQRPPSPPPFIPCHGSRAAPPDCDYG
jgi:hypothetical protein